MKSICVVGMGMDALVMVCPGNMHVIVGWAWMRDRMLSEHERYCGLGMDALVIACSRNTNVIMVWAWMRLLSFALGTRTLSWFGHGCTSTRMLAEHERSYGLGMDDLLSYALGTRTLLWFGHGFTIYRIRCYRMLSEHEHYYGLGMDAR